MIMGSGNFANLKLSNTIDALDPCGDERRLINRSLVGTVYSTDQLIVMKIISLFAITLILKANILTGNSAPTETPIRWVTKFSEYKAVCLQTDAAAWEKVDAGRRTRNRGLRHSDGNLTFWDLPE